ncbi:conserved hypothetical protein [Dehalogenimonas lykanthroporepellens BL-DC-9]|nr:conserved hypothetical protein [Dehalogenimonas lykanthroporepellens BL-DC-9]
MLDRLSRLLAVELKLGYYIFKWVFQRDRLTLEDYTYHRKSAAMALTFAFLFATPAAIILLAVILAQDWLTWILSIVALYGLYRTVGLYASMVALPHRVGPTALEIRFGALAWMTIPYNDIESASLSFEGVGLSGDGLKLADREPTAYFSVGSTTRIKIILRRPLPVMDWKGTATPVSTVFLNADRPDQLVAALEEKTGSVGQGAGA